MRARLEIAAHFYEVVVLKLRQSFFLRVGTHRYNFFFLVWAGTKLEEGCYSRAGPRGESVRLVT